MMKIRYLSNLDSSHVLGGSGGGSGTVFDGRAIARPEPSGGGGRNHRGGGSNGDFPPSAAGSGSGGGQPRGAEEAFFDDSAPRNVSALVGKTAFLTCIVRNLGKTKSVNIFSYCYS